MAKILIVEDDKQTRDILVRMLAVLQYETATVETVYEGLGYLTTSKTLPDVVLLDYRLPVLNGLEFVKRLQQNPDWRDIPIVVISASLSNRAQLSIFDAGAKAFISKPFDLKQLKHVIEPLLPDNE